ncbi:MAG TPA: NUDIX hydrolase [Cytophagaceae bacterium]|jgi:8-oxo-dGTP diphosphatase
MEITTKSLQALHGNKVRVRVCGIHVVDKKILLVKHKGLGPQGILWAPPGGGIEFAETLSTGLRREMWEETGLKVVKEEFLFIHEFINEPLHAIELFFKVETTDNKILLGFDPEYDEQMISDVKYFGEEEIFGDDPSMFHQIFKITSCFNEILALKGIVNG